MLVIRLFLLIASLDVVGVILSSLSMGASAADEITSSVTLYKSAVYRYNGSRVGYAYDPTVYSTYVRVITRSGTGEFTGGYTADGDFDWVHSTISSAFHYSYSAIADTTIYNYNADLNLHGYCSMYYPD